MQITVNTFQPTLQIENSKRIDWMNRSDRKWLDSHLHWAMNNQRMITLQPITSDSI